MTKGLVSIWLLLAMLIPALYPADLKAQGVRRTESDCGRVIRAQCLIFQGPFHINLPLLLLHPAENRASVRLSCPSNALLPQKIYLVKDGDALLKWVDPASARDPLQDDHALLTAMKALPAAGWEALLTGRDLKHFMKIEDDPHSAESDQASGLLGGLQARLHYSGEQSRSLTIQLPDGEWRLVWRLLEQARRIILDIQSPDGRLIRVKSRHPRLREIGDEEWLFVTPVSR
ncbi:MAG: hypothetical protein GY835_21445 [bacterium]|nr:hypothetical protein [bacterium]